MNTTAKLVRLASDLMKSSRLRSKKIAAFIRYALNVSSGSISGLAFRQNFHPITAPPPV